jgi:hypothetical protein
MKRVLSLSLLITLVSGFLAYHFLKGHQRPQAAADTGSLRPELIESKRGKKQFCGASSCSVELASNSSVEPRR